MVAARLVEPLVALVLADDGRVVGPGHLRLPDDDERVRARRVPLAACVGLLAGSLRRRVAVSSALHLLAPLAPPRRPRALSRPLPPPRCGASRRRRGHAAPPAPSQTAPRHGAPRASE